MIDEVGHYVTPAPILRELARFVPLDVRLCLDPAVGSGALLSMVDEVGAKCLLAGCDIVLQRLREVRDRLSHVDEARLRLFHGDFLDWIVPNDLTQPDLIVVNPPFSTRHILNGQHENSFLPDGKAAAPEVIYFTMRAVDLLPVGGRLIAVLPKSLGMYERFGPFRSILRNSLTNITTIEFGGRLFANYEGPVFALVGDKVRSCRHLESTSGKAGTTHESSNGQPFVASYQKSRDEFEKLVAKRKDLNWTKVKDAASVHRGRGSGSWWKHRALHLFNRDGLVWDGTTRRHSPSKHGPCVARSTDIAVARVSRKLHETLGVVKCGNRARVATDCVLLIRPKRGTKRYELLFALRIMFQLPCFRASLVRGTGAQFLPQSDFEEIKIPLGLASRFRAKYADFQRAIELNDVEQAVAIERAVSARL